MLAKLHVVRVTNDFIFRELMSLNPQSLSHWPCDIVATLLFCVAGDKVLLIHKKRGLGAGKINGPGGKLEDDETLEQCACRETLEETGVQASNARSAGTLCFSFSDGLRLRVHAFVSEDFHGEPTETDEAIPFWQDIAAIPFERMWADDRLWLPHVLAGGQAFGHFHFEDDTLLSHTLELM